MATAFATVVQQAIFDRLTGQVGAMVRDDVPDQPAGLPGSDFPFVVIGNDVALPFETDDTRGMSVSVTLHVWSRGAGMKEARQIVDAIYARLHRASLTATGYHIVDCLHETSFFERETHLRHGVTRYRLTIQEAA